MNDFRKYNKRLSKTDRTFYEIKSLLPNFLNKFEKKQRNFPKEIFEKWPEIIGDKFAKWTKPVSFEKGILKVKVISSALYSLLVNYEKKRLLNMLQNNFPEASIRNIKFIIG